MAHISRRELKKDEFISGLDAAWAYFLDHRRVLLTAGIIVLAAVLIAWGALGWRRHQRSRAQSLLAAGLQLYHDPIAAQSSPSGPRTFPNSRARAQAALAKFQQAASYASTRGGRLARYYSGLAQIAAGDRARGLATLRQLAHGSHPNLAALARTALANDELSQGHDAQAIAQLQKLLQHPAPAVPRAAVLWQLAGVERLHHPRAAARLYRELIHQYPNTPTAESAARRLQQQP